MYISQEQRKFLITVVGGVLILVLDIFLIIKPMVTKISNLQGQARKLNKNIGELNLQISKFNYIVKKLETLKSDYAIYGNKFPKEAEMPSLLEAISATAVASKTVISALKITEAAGEKEAPSAGILREVPIEISVKGGYHQLGTFINKLETVDKFLKIKNVEITYETITPRKHNLKLLVSTYTLKNA